MAIEIRGFHDWIIHEDIASAVDAYLDAASTPAWRHRKLPKTDVSETDAEAENDAEAPAAEGAEGVEGAEEDQLEILPVVASALPGEGWFEYCALAEGDTLPDPGDRQEVAVKFR